MLGQERRVHLGLGTKAQMNTPFLGHVGAMLDLRWVYVGMCLQGLSPSFTELDCLGNSRIYKLFQFISIHSLP